MRINYRHRERGQMSHSVEIIAEIGNNAAGDVSLAKRMIAAAKECGATAAKFQVIHPATLVAKGEPAFALLARESFRDADFAMLKEHCDCVGIEFLATPFDLAAVALLDRLGVKRFKVASGDIVWPELLRDLARRGKPVLLACGGATDVEIERALGWLGPVPVALLHCVAAYPPPDAQMNLPRIPHLRERFGKPVGLSDHTSGLAVALGAVALGATVIEKHFTVDRSLPGVDNPMSITPDELQQLVDGSNRIAAALADRGDGPVPAEAGFLVGGRRALVAARDLPAGTILRENDLVALRPRRGLGAEERDAVIGRKLNAPLAVGAILTGEEIE